MDDVRVILGTSMAGVLAIAIHTLGEPRDMLSIKAIGICGEYEGCVKSLLKGCVWFLQETPFLLTLGFKGRNTPKPVKAKGF